MPAHPLPRQSLRQRLPSWALAALQSMPRGRVPQGLPQQRRWVLSSHWPQNKALSAGWGEADCVHTFSPTLQSLRA